MVDINHLSTPIEYAKLASIEYGHTNLISSGLNNTFEKICERSKRFGNIMSYRFNTWKISLYKNKEKNEHIVVFRGTHPTSIGNWLQDFLYFLKFDKNVRKWMNRKMDEFTRIIGMNVNTFVGHSAGGYLATVIKKDWKVYRVTFNGLKCKKKDLNFNLRLHGDFVSKRPLSNKHNYISVSNGNSSGHALKGFIDSLDTYDWNNYYPDRFSERYLFSNIKFNFDPENQFKTSDDEDNIDSDLKEEKEKFNRYQTYEKQQKFTPEQANVVAGTGIAGVSYMTTCKNIANKLKKQE